MASSGPDEAWGAGRGIKLPFVISLRSYPPGREQRQGAPRVNTRDLSVTPYCYLVVDVSCRLDESLPLLPSS